MNESRGKTSCEFCLRPSHSGDFELAQRLYINCMKPLLTNLGAWDEADTRSRFASYFDTRQIKVVQVDGEDIGWVQVSETDSDVNLDQIHLMPAFQRHGIGSSIILDIMRATEAKRKPLLLSIVRGNKAIELYKRLGFKLDSSDATKIHMRWDA
jgi:ribosomal protein S18 acetylase RimI-like enzyme